MRIPQRGLDRDTLFERMESFRADDARWREGRAWTYIYDAGAEIEQVAKEAYLRFLSENALDPTFFPSLLRFEREVVAMAASHLGGDDRVVGSFTSGGTESCMLAVKTARDYFRAKKPELSEPEMILPVTAHAAFHKAARYFDVRVRPVPVDRQTFCAEMEAVRQAITPRTILLVGSAPCYGYGVVDPIVEMAELAAGRGLLLHVDACIGGFLLPYLRRLGEPVPDFDLSVPGVTSISMDLHKYAFCSKGASVVLYRDKDLRKHQIFTCSRWTGYTVANTTMQSTKSGGPVAAAWAVLHYVGEERYLQITREMRESTKRLVEGIRAIPELRLLGEPQMTLIAFDSPQVSVFHIADELKLRGWHVLVQLDFEGYGENLHLSVNPSNNRWVDAFLADLRASVEAARSLPPSPVAAMVRQTLARTDPSEISDEVLARLTTMAGMQGTRLPPRMAEINEILNVLPTEISERLLLEFFNDLFVSQKEPG